MVARSNSATYWWTEPIATEPSPTVPATRFYYTVLVVAALVTLSSFFLLGVVGQSVGLTHADMGI